MSQQQWYIVRGEKEEVPYTGTALKDMAASGKLKPRDLVRRADVETARPTSQIKGLFTGGDAAEALLRKLTAVQPTAAAPASKKRLVIVGAVVAALVRLCGGVGVLVTVFNKEKQAAQKELAEADALWTSGDKAGAAAKYRALLQNRSHKAAVKDELVGHTSHATVHRTICPRLERGSADSRLLPIPERLETPDVGATVPQRQPLGAVPEGVQLWA
jgi:hypothetical protein